MRLLPHGVAVVLFMAISLAYFAPQLQGRRVAQHDREQWLGTARELIDYRDSTGRESLWTTTLFCGMPSILISQGYPKNVVEIIDRGLQFLGRPASYIFLTMLGFYILLVVVGVNPWLAIPGAIAYGLSTYFLIIVGAGHNAKSHALCYVAPMVAGFIAVFKGKYWGGGLLFGARASGWASANHLLRWLCAGGACGWLSRHGYSRGATAAVRQSGGRIACSHAVRRGGEFQ